MLIFLTILKALNLRGKLAHLNNITLLLPRITFVQDYGCFYKYQISIISSVVFSVTFTLQASFLIESKIEELEYSTPSSALSSGHSVVPPAISSIAKYMQENWQ